QVICGTAVFWRSGDLKLFLFHFTKEDQTMAKKSKKSRRPMKKGECRRTKSGQKYCKLANGKVKFRKG
ncbi:MAG: hypothetical protein ABIK89_15320, partial [Planctomycetota bacterium]